MNAARGVLVVLVALVTLVIAVAIGYGIGLDAGRGSLECTAGVVLSVKVTGGDAQGNGTHELSVGDCDRIDEGAFVAAVAALTNTSMTTTTTTTTTTTAPTPPSTAATP